jgi:hypothetical protein
MKGRAPPQLATWLFLRLGNLARSASFIGDLAEEYAHGRSRLWYWRQVLGALAVCGLRSLRKHSPTFLLAVAAGCAFTIAWQAANSFAWATVFRYLWGVSLSSENRFDLLFIGWVFNRAAFMGFAFAAAWIVTRIHRGHQRAALVAFVIALAAQRIPLITRLAFDVLRDQRFVVSLVNEIFAVFFEAAWTLVGGLLAIRSQRLSDMDRRTQNAILLAAALTVWGSTLFAASRLAGIPLPPSRPGAFVCEGAQIAALAYLVFRLWRPQQATDNGASRTPATTAAG